MVTLTLDEATGRQRAALSLFFEAVGRLSPAQWEQPVAPGKWSPGQLAEHLALTYEIAAQAVRGTSSIPALPKPVRPILRALVLWTIRRGKFPRGGRAVKSLLPSDRVADREGILARLAKAADDFAAESSAALRKDHSTFVHPLFGTMRVVDYVLLNDLHTRHHTAQLPAAAS